MFIVRQALPTDLDDLHALAKQTFFINLPPDRDIIADKIAQSQACFAALVRPTSKAKASAAKGVMSSSTKSPRSGLKALTGYGDLFLMVLENTETRSVIGTSQVIARMGGPGHPRFFMSLHHAECTSRSLGLGWRHLVGRMGSDESGPTELGGLILNHAFRGHPLRLGRLLSFVRFHLIGLHRQRFADQIVAEMLGPITRTGYNPFYEKFTRHFITRPFADVYRFSQTSREFLDTLMPKGEIFLSILDPEVANAAGEVSDDTRPAQRLLERMGFVYHNRIDPLDGGPHLEAVTAKIGLVKATRKVTAFVAAAKASRQRGSRRKDDAAGAPNMIVSTLDRRGGFRAMQTIGSVEKSTVSLPVGDIELVSDTPEAIWSRGVTTLGE